MSRSSKARWSISRADCVARSACRRTPPRWPPISPTICRDFLALVPACADRDRREHRPETLRAIAENAADIGIYGDVVVPIELSSFVYRQDRLALLVPARTSAFRRRCRDTGAMLPGIAFIGTPRGASIDTALTTGGERSWRFADDIHPLGGVRRNQSAGRGGARYRRDARRRRDGFTRVRCSVKAMRLDEPWAERRLMICVRDRCCRSHRRLLPSSPI